MPFVRLPATASATAAETAAAKTAATGATAPASATAKDKGWKPIVVVLSAMTLLSGRWFYYTHLLKDAANYQ